MMNLMLLVLLVSTQVAMAEVDSGIHSIVRGTHGEPHLVKFKSGIVKIVEQGNVAELKAYETQLGSQKLRSISLANETLPLVEEVPFQPSVVPDREISAIFNRMNPHIKRKSECSDRAHVWSWDEEQRSGIKSQKAFLFLTDAYIRRTGYKWWFHVAPLFTTASGQKIVMDYQFLDRPVPFTQWKNLLVFSKRECVTDFKFNDYNRGADQTQDCYTKFEPMYYHFPAEIGARENGTPRTQWNTAEVLSSRARAFSKGSR